MTPCQHLEVVAERCVECGVEVLDNGSRPGWDAVGTRPASGPSEKGQTAIASPRPDVVGTRDGTRSFSDAIEAPDLLFVDALVFAEEDEQGAAALLGSEDDVLIPEGADVMMYGDGGAGKTTLAIDLAAHLAAGDDWIGFPMARSARVGLIENEGPLALSLPLVTSTWLE